MSETPTKTAFWSTQRGTYVAFAIAAFATLIACFWNIQGIGIWEPWEANDIAVAQEYATRGDAPEKTKPEDKSWNWAVPTKGKRLVSRSLLKTMVLSKTVGSTDVTSSKLGAIERGARMPFAIVLLLFSLGSFFWVRKRFNTLAALIATVAFASMPAIYIGAHNIASELFLVVSTSAALLLFFELSDANQKWRWPLGVAWGLSLALAFLDLRLFGLYLPLFVISIAGIAAAVADPGRKFSKWDVAPVAALVLAVVIQLWVTANATSEDVMYAPHHRQWMALLFPLYVMGAALVIGRGTWVTKTFFSLPTLLGSILAVVPIVAVGVAYGDVNPVLLRDGVIVGKIPVFEYLLENQIFDKSVATGHVTFDVWIRQIGFSLLPWGALAPLGFAYLTRAGETASVRVRTFMVVWIAGAFLFTALGSTYQHYFFAGYFPLALGIGAAFADPTFWKTLKEEPLSKFAIGAFALAIILMLGKDVERFPARFIEVYLSMQDGFDLPDDFSYGSLYKPLKYVWLVTLGVFFFSWLSFGIRVLKSLRTPKDAIKKAFAPAAFDAAEEQRQAIYESDNALFRMIGLIESPRTFGLVLCGVFGLSMFITLQSFIPNVTDHLSQRGVFETYTETSGDDEPLYRFQVSARENSVYLSDVDMLNGNREFQEKFGAPERLFAVIPRAKLASINMQIRKKYKRNLHVLDARSSRLILVSNQLKEGEEDQNFVADLIVEGEPKPQVSLERKMKNGEMAYPVFDNQLEFIGYDLDKQPGADGLVPYKWGDTATLTYYFRVLKKVPSNQKIFLHVDYPGVRINGDHFPNSGKFPTNYWLEGDVVKSVHPLEIESYSTPGEYTLHFGFFLGSRRMKITPKDFHDGSNRINIGKIRVTSGI